MLVLYVARVHSNIYTNTTTTTNNNNNIFIQTIITQPGMEVHALAGNSYTYITLGIVQGSVFGWDGISQLHVSAIVKLPVAR